ncbi:hypothetical protein BDK51DRAFT_48360 [Blyttiomyces helicus]|uniref:Pentacotripeptide-repeat region of PRORP domain-containing protein n=1 Tax=Blyttiomyces helicus TaxID=388810 RepID=A0A4V1IQ96_9FUNG|nr:hypothetical protein BDK51DRAFT_48360 [Blyttiomyces helicus]|eukprot:RKO85787.1 hypothetical protein BDK51DRAFT_48360 [Blyttiomyces helicus]
MKSRYAGSAWALLCAIPDEPNQKILEKLLAVCGATGNLELAESILAAIPGDPKKSTFFDSPDVLCYFMLTCARAGDCKRAAEIYEFLRTRIPVSDTKRALACANGLLQAYADVGEIGRFRHLAALIEAEGPAPNAATLEILIARLSTIPGAKPDVLTYLERLRVDIPSKGKPTRARDSWHAAINSCIEDNDYETARSLIAEMNTLGIKQDGTTRGFIVRMAAAEPERDVEKLLRQFVKEWTAVHPPRESMMADIADAIGPLAPSAAAAKLLFVDEGNVDRSSRFAISENPAALLSAALAKEKGWGGKERRGEVGGEPEHDERPLLHRARGDDDAPVKMVVERPWLKSAKVRTFRKDRDRSTPTLPVTGGGSGEPALESEATSSAAAMSDSSAPASPSVARFEGELGTAAAPSPTPRTIAAVEPALEPKGAAQSAAEISDSPAPASPPVARVEAEVETAAAPLPTPAATVEPAIESKATAPSAAKMSDPHASASPPITRAVAEPETAAGPLPTPETVAAVEPALESEATTESAAEMSDPPAPASPPIARAEAHTVTAAAPLPIPATVAAVKPVIESEATTQSSAAASPLLARAETEVETAAAPNRIAPDVMPGTPLTEPETPWPAPFLQPATLAKPQPTIVRRRPPVTYCGTATDLTQIRALLTRANISDLKMPAALVHLMKGYSGRDPASIHALFAETLSLYVPQRGRPNPKHPQPKPPLRDLADATIAAFASHSATGDTTLAYSTISTLRTTKQDPGPRALLKLFDLAVSRTPGDFRSAREIVRCLEEFKVELYPEERAEIGARHRMKMVGGGLDMKFVKLLEERAIGPLREVVGRTRQTAFDEEEDGRRRKGKGKRGKREYWD